MAKPPTTTSINCPGCGTAVEIPMKLSAVGREATVVLDTSAIRAHVAEHDTAEPTLGFIVSDTAAWPGVDDAARYEQLLGWLRANCIEPSDIPIDSTVYVEPGPDEYVIRHVALLRNSDGKRYVDPSNPGDPAQEQRVVPMLTPLPWRHAAVAGLPPVRPCTRHTGADRERYGCTGPEPTEAEASIHGHVPQVCERDPSVCCSTPPAPDGSQ